MKQVLLIKYGEISLRGDNRHLLEKRLIGSIKKRTARVGDFRVSGELGRFVLEYAGTSAAAGQSAVAEVADWSQDWDHVIDIVKNVPGIIGVCPALRMEHADSALLPEVALAFLKQRHTPPYTFKVDTRRANKHLPVRSQDINEQLGGMILDQIPGTSVKLKQPDVTLHIELRNHAYIYTDTIAAVGGLPYTSSGRGVLMLSGGIDSPVAGYMMAKRGVDMTCAYMHSPPYTSELAKEKVLDLAKQISRYTDYIRLYVVPFTEVQLYLKEHVPSDKLTIFLKRAMLRISDGIAQAERCLCIVTGDSVGQVASQTIHSIAAVNSATKLPILRPLAAMDKHEITAIAQEIGTYEISIRPYEDCCTIFVDKHPETKPKVSIIESIESRLARLIELCDAAVKNSEIITFGG